MAAVRRAFTLVELLVVTAVTGVLIGLLMPAVQQAREAARRTACLNHQKQLGLALHGFHATHGVFPPSGWTVAGPGNPNGKYVGWRALCLPYLEQENLRDMYDFDLHWWEGANLTVAGQRLNVFECPSVPQRGVVMSAVAKSPRPAMTFPLPLAATDYEAIMGVQSSVDPVLYATSWANRSVLYRNSRVRIADVLDGSSQTIAIVECAARPLVFRGTTLRADLSNDQGQGWIDSEGAFSLDGAHRDGSLQGQGPVLTPVALNATNENEPYAFHPAGANVIFADGSARFVHSTISLRRFAALCTKSGGEAVQAP